MGNGILMAQYFINIFNGIRALVGGMSLTIKHMRKKKELVATMQYPHEKWPLPEKDIGFDHKEYNVIRSRLHVDIDDCIGCLQCERACPVDCIKIDTIKPPKDSDYDCGKTSFGTQKKMIVPRFTIDMSECMYCNLCVYPCPEECIYMVGGPNEDKHEIDYEFSQFERKGLIFEFANSTDQDIIDVGGKDYLDKREAKAKNLEKGTHLEGRIIEDKPVEKKAGSKKVAVKTSSKPDIKSLNVIEDKMARGLAKKIFLGALKNSQDIDFIMDAVENALRENNKLDDQLVTQLNEIKVSLKSAPQQSVEEVKDEFSIKSFNVIEDKMARGLCKKIYLSGKKQDTKPALIAKEITSTLKEKGLMSDDVKSIIKEMIMGGGAPKQKKEEGALFDIKLLNSIEDKMTRGLAKKVYIAGKKASNKTNEVVNEIISELDKNQKLDDGTKKILEDILA